jgi:hypothetical protein
MTRMVRYLVRHADAGNKDDLAKGSVWVIGVAHGTITETRYLQPFKG